ncbi:MAG: hypothetical protein ABID38_04770 [Candidatus Diapherotrites archaeon]
MGWTHIILEAYCARKWSDKKDKYWYEVVDLKKFKTKKAPNPHYNANYRTPRKPNYCPNAPRYICLEKNCPHLTYTDALEKDYLFLNKRYKKKAD